MLPIRKNPAAVDHSLGARDLAAKCGVSIPTVVLAIDFLGLRDEKDCYKEVRIGKSTFKRYSMNVIAKIQSCLQASSLSQMRFELRNRRSRLSDAKTR
jgi:hypothetical protein